MTKAKQKQNKKTANKHGLVKKENKTVIKKMTIKEVKGFINQMAYAECDPKQIMKKLSEDLLPQIRDGKANKKTYEKTKEVVSKALISVYGLETHYPLAETVNENYRPLIIEFSNQLIKEYDCQNYSEKALVEIIANAYLKVIDNSRRYNNCLEAAEYVSDERTKYLAMLSKQIDRANRQFITALTTLKQIKMPSLSVSVKTKTAFVAQNQQLNVNPSDNSNKNEIIKPK